MTVRYGEYRAFQKVIVPYFYTSNIDKLLQARLLFVKSGYDLRHFTTRKEPYEEDYSGGTAELLRHAISQISGDFGVRAVFFVEDTSLRVEALSDGRDYPGLQVKEWFSKTSFDELDSQIRLRGGDRSVTVKSDIALKLPTLSRPILFHGETHGVLAPSLPAFPRNEQYPWLTPDTFNGWFIPHGSDRRLGEMEFEESLNFDFRAKAFRALIERIEEYDAALNLLPQHYVARHFVEGGVNQHLLFPLQEKRVVVVIGHKCAGKTTMADYLSAGGEVAVVEASSVLRAIAEDCGKKIASASDAIEFLNEKGFGVVGREIVDYVTKSVSQTVLVTGLRTVEELAELVSEYPDVVVINVVADPRVRFERHIRRARDRDVKTYADFLDMDEVQRAFGMMRVADELADVNIVNDAGMPEFHRKIREVFAQALSHERIIRVRGPGRRTELHRSLRALARLNRAATCEEIEDETEVEERVRRYNNNRALKEVPEFADRIEKRGQLLSYRITPRGRVLVQLLDQFVDGPVER